MKIRVLVVILLFISTWGFGDHDSPYYGSGLCDNPQYYCIKVKKNNSWKKLFPNPKHRDLVQRINRTNMRLRRGKIIAVPHNIDELTIYDISPFPNAIKKTGEKTIIVDQEKLAWGAYDTNGYLVKWGPISSGKDYCPDVRRECTTITGIYYIFHKKDRTCVSNIFPVGEGGAKMPYCMFFYRGFALHGSHEVPGYRDSHGCVRLFTEDAKWLNEKFVELLMSKYNFKGTKVIIQKLININKGKKK